MTTGTTLISSFCLSHSIWRFCLLPSILNVPAIKRNTIHWIHYIHHHQGVKGTNEKEKFLSLFQQTKRHKTLSESKSNSFLFKTTWAIFFLRCCYLSSLFSCHKKARKKNVKRFILFISCCEWKKVYDKIIHEPSMALVKMWKLKGMEDVGQLKIARFLTKDVSHCPLRLLCC